MILFDAYSLEFKNQTTLGNLYLCSIIVIPVMLLLTMTGTIIKKNSTEKNGKIFGITLTLALGIFFTLLALGLRASFGGWTNEAILFRNKANKNISINEQIYDVGALGYDRNSKRIVKIKRVLKYFNQVMKMDTSKLNKEEWIFVNEIGDIHD